MVKPRTSADSDIYLLDTAAADAKPKLITPHDGNISHGVHEFTPDSGKLVYSTDEHGEFQQAWTYDLGTGETEPLVSADWNVDFVTYSDSGRYRVWGTNADARTAVRSEEHTSELQSLMRITYAVFCLKKKNKKQIPYNNLPRITR